VEKGAEKREQQGNDELSRRWSRGRSGGIEQVKKQDEGAGQGALRAAGGEAGGGRGREAQRGVGG
jgi:hypothetical protein